MGNLDKLDKLVKQIRSGTAIVLAKWCPRTLARERPGSARIWAAVPGGGEPDPFAPTGHSAHFRALTSHCFNDEFVLKGASQHSDVGWGGQRTRDHASRQLSCQTVHCCCGARDEGSADLVVSMRHVRSLPGSPGRTPSRAPVPLLPRARPAESSEPAASAKRPRNSAPRAMGAASGPRWRTASVLPGPARRAPGGRTQPADQACRHAIALAS